MRVKCESSAAHLLMSRRSEAEYDMMLIEHQAAELTDTLHLDQDGRGAAARSAPRRLRHAAPSQQPEVAAELTERRCSRDLPEGYTGFS